MCILSKKGFLGQWNLDTLEFQSSCLRATTNERQRGAYKNIKPAKEKEPKRRRPMIKKMCAETSG